jgi:hypothetical protein
MNEYRCAAFTSNTLACLFIGLLLVGCASRQGVSGRRSLILGIGVLAEANAPGGPVQTTITTLGLTATIGQCPRGVALGYRRTITVQIPRDWQGTLQFDHGTLAAQAGAQ